MLGLNHAKKKINEHRDERRASKDFVRKLEIAKESKEDATTRKTQKRDQYISVITKQSGTPLEKLIKRVHELPGAATPTAGKYDPVTKKEDKKQSGQTNTNQNQTGQKQTAPKEKKKKASGLRYASSVAVGKVTDFFTGWGEKLKHLGGWAEAQEAAANGPDLLSEATDFAEFTDALSKKQEKQNGYVNSAAGFFSTLFSGANLVLKIAGEIKNRVQHKSDDRDAQERWKAARGYMRQFVEVLEGLTAAGGAISEIVLGEIPLFGPILSLCKGTANFVLDVMDMISNAVHVESMRKRRNELYERIERKRAKYTRQEEKAEVGSDAETNAKLAKEAYTVGHTRFRRARNVDDKRKELMETIYKSKYGEKATGKAKMRSKNDSAYSESLYNIGSKIRMLDGIQDRTTDPKRKAEIKTQKRQLEALEMMEEFREADKAHKKMSKAVAHNVEAIVTGGTHIGLNIAKIAGLATGGAVTAGAILADHIVGGLEYVRSGVSKAYSIVKVFRGTDANKATTREDMAISLINKMEDVGTSSIWNAGKFKTEAELKGMGVDGGSGYKSIIRDGRKVEHLHSILRSGLDSSMSELIHSDSKNDIKEKIAESFGQE